MKLTIDVENTVVKREGKMHLDPFEPSNKLVLVGCLEDNGQEHLFNMDVPDGIYLQELLDKATIIIGHNIAYDLMWLWETGYKYDGPVFDTMLAEYVLQRGKKEPLSLEECAKRHELATQKEDTLKHYFAQGVGVDGIPRDELKEYLSADLKATQELSDLQYKRLNSKEDAGLMNTVVFTNKVSVALAKIYRRGFKVDTDTLKSVELEFQKEKLDIERRLKGQVKELMGDTPINMNSPEQMSWILYSRKPKDKSLWMNHFGHTMEKTKFHQTVKENSDIVYKTKAEKCWNCYGAGTIKKYKKDGSLYAKLPKCPKCNGEGFVFVNSGKIAGFRFNPPNVKWVSANGFSVNKKMLEVLQHVTKRNDSMEAYNFLADIQRLSSLDTYLSSFVDGIKIHTKTDGMLHVRLLQHRTATGRFSGADPNMQNMPRGGTFPVKKVFVSRWKGGKILEADFAQLEFRTAAFLSQDKVAMKEIEDGFDVHSYTANVITESGQKISRQEAKAHTFAPLYGATGFGRTNAEAKYYEQFTKKYKEIALWHSRLAKEAINTRKIRIPSGREFSFPDVERRVNGTVSHFTQIKNYPVQSFATADIVPLVLMKIDERLSTCKSCIVNTVHDSIVIDVHPEEQDQVLFIIKSINNDMKTIIDNYYGINFNVPLLLEAKMGDNWLDTKEVS
jgi:DNA polymerase I-like protein with 3'-5' exonuclease and polymerase domains